MHPVDGARPHALLDPGCKGAIEHAVSTQLNRPWHARLWDDRNHLASQPAALLSDGTTTIFAKYADDDLAAERFAQEAFGLSLLAQTASISTPAVLGVVTLPVGTVLLLEAVQVLPTPGTADWRELGRALAHLHEISGPHYGLDRNGYWGPLPQDNTFCNDWTTFYVQRRILPRLTLAEQSGHLPCALARQVEALVDRLPDLDVPSEGPRLLHGDAHRNNLLLTTRGPVFIDPSAHYGHPEYDLAYIDFFTAVPPALFNGYREVRDVAPGFQARRGLWRLHAWLVMIAFGDTSYVPDVAATVRRWL